MMDLAGVPNNILIGCSQPQRGAKTEINRQGPSADTKNQLKCPVDTSLHASLVARFGVSFYKNLTWPYTDAYWYLQTKGTLGYRVELLEDAFLNCGFS